MKTLEDYRREINQIDEDLLVLLAKRFAVVRKIGMYKKQNNLSVVDELREEEIIKSLIAKGAMVNMSSSCVTTIWKAIFSESYTKENHHE